MELATQLITLGLFGLFILASFYMGVKAGRGEMIDLIPKKFKPIVRTEEQEADLIKKLRSK